MQLSINTRLTLSAGIVLASFVILTAAALDRAFFDSARSAVRDRQLGQIYLLLAAAEVDAKGQISMPKTLAEARLNVPGSGLYAQITSGNGDSLWQSHSVLGRKFPSPQALRPGEQRFGQIKDENDTDFFVYSYAINWETESGILPFTFHIAEDLKAFHAQIRHYRHSLWGWLGGMALLLLIAQAAILRWGLFPLRRVAIEVASIESGKQDRIQGAYPGEIEKLTNNLNALLRHERSQQTRYREALANLAHSLKTPLAVIRMASDGAENQSESSVAMEEQIERMDQIISYQLQRAATAGPSGMMVKPVVVLPVAEKIVAALKKVHHDKSVQIQLEIDAGICFRGDQGDLMELLGNLIENAFKWCHNRIRLSAGIKGNRLFLTIDDDGPGIPAGQVEQILDRGVRADQSVPGQGIGLAVVRDIVHAYAGSIQIGNGGLGGASLILELPACTGSRIDSDPL